MLGLSLRTQAIVRAIAATLFEPGGGHTVPEPRLEWTARELAHYCSLAGTRTSRGIALILFGVQILPLFIIGKLRRFTSLKPADRRRYLEAMEHSRLFAPLFATTKIMLSLIYFEHPDALREAGITPECAHAPLDPAGLRVPEIAGAP